MPRYTRRQTLRLSISSLWALSSASAILAGCEPTVDDGDGLELSLDPNADPIDDPPIGDPDPPVSDTDPPMGDTGEPPPQPLDWTGFLDALADMAQDQYGAGWNHEDYVRAVSELMLRVDPQTRALADALSDYRDRFPGFPEITTLHEEIDFEVSVLQFEAGERIDLHNHPDMTGVIRCLSGDVSIESYDLVAGPVLLARLRETVRLTEGDTATLTPTRGNIHALEAHAFTELLDVFTPPYAGDRLQRYRWYGRAAEPTEPGGDVYQIWET